MTDQFVHSFFGKIFDNPSAVFTEEILRPEAQDLDVFVDGINNIVEAQQRVAQRYIDDGSIEDACPPLKTLLYIMANGEHEGIDAHHPEFRAMFTRERLLDADWYKERLQIKQIRDIRLWQRHVSNLQQFLDDVDYADEAERLGIDQRLDKARAKLEQVQSEEYLQQLAGSLGADPLGPAACMAENQLMSWTKAKISLVKDNMAENDVEAVPAHNIPSLLQRFKTRFRRDRLH